MRRMVREGIEAVARGEDPQGIDRSGDAVTPIYANEIIKRAPPAATSDADKALIREVSRAAFDQVRAGQRPRTTTSAPG